MRHNTGTSDKGTNWVVKITTPSGRHVSSMGFATEKEANDFAQKERYKLFIEGKERFRQVQVIPPPNNSDDPDAKVMPFEMQVSSLKRIFSSLNPDVDRELIDWRHELDATLSLPENRLEMSIKFPQYRWFKDVAEERGVKREALEELEGYLGYLLSALPEEMRPDFEKVFEDYTKRVRTSIEKKLRIAPLKREIQKLRSEVEKAKARFVPKAPPKVAKAVEFPPIPEEEGITDEWLEEVKKIDPSVKPEVMTTTAYNYEVGLYKYIPQVEDSLPMGVMPLDNPVEVEKFLKLGTYDGWTWIPQDITYLGDYEKFREIWSKTYSRSDLEPLLRKDLDEIARVKHLSASGTKEEVIARILAIELPAAPPTLAPVARPPPSKKVEKGLGFYEEKQIRDRFYARLSRAGLRVTPEIRAEYREKYLDLEKRLREVERDEALKKAQEEIDALGDEIARRPRIRPPLERPLPIEQRLRDLFDASLTRAGLSPTRFRAELRLELETIRTLPTEELMLKAIESFAEEIIARERKPPRLRPPERPRREVTVPPWREEEIEPWPYAAAPAYPRLPLSEMPFPRHPAGIEGDQIFHLFVHDLTVCGIYNAEAYRSQYEQYFLGVMFKSWDAMRKGYEMLVDRICKGLPPRFPEELQALPFKSLDKAVYWLVSLRKFKSAEEVAAELHRLGTPITTEDVKMFIRKGWEEKVPNFVIVTREYLEQLLGESLL